ncbi:hypothetical protein I7I51_08681 [Histoplasma capsulatum]|uniref:Uncharacterized protein n=1 Tax=Ajellomyces capsulatus TaxID=5037 RepID=A0A8A1LYI6_AJECA|nr:predicted protein [Histoplasma mississippiense (nom. inval.)]EDN04185.1 predicted protein [Histoplasma mississippiense (nom. inval.)]QSS59248.1 hypothetical protein I7I51_08681 [Histoplasma capsulatum]
MAAEEAEVSRAPGGPLDLVIPLRSWEPEHSSNEMRATGMKGTTGAARAATLSGKIGWLMSA